MANLSDLRKEVKLHANNCPDITIDYALIRALRTFCRESRYYQATIYIDQTAATTNYNIVPADNSEVHELESVELTSNNKLYPLTQEEASRSDGSVTGFYFYPPNVLSIYPQPTTTVVNGIEVRAVLIPPENTTTLPDSIYRNFKETIVSGALAYILSMQNEAWSNEKLAAYKNQEFVIGMFNAKGQTMRDFRAGGIKIKTRPFLI